MGRTRCHADVADNYQGSRVCCTTASKTRPITLVASGASRRMSLLKVELLFCLSLVALLVQGGCGSGGYPGAGIASLTASVITIDAGQSIAVGANGSGNLPLTWTLSTGNCSASGCGTLSSSSGTSITYMAPSPVATPFQVTLSATVAGTKNARTVTIKVNPAPVISGTPPAGTVGTPYSFSFGLSGGTAPLKLSLQSGTLPAGLTFNAATGTVSGTPTAVGASSFVLQLVDSSDVPYTVTAPKTIAISAANTGAGLSVRGNPPGGTVGTPYSTTLQASGGTGPYTFSIASGALPAGLTLNAATGVISGTPSAAGASAFTAQVRDAGGNTASGPFTIAVTAGTGSSGIGVSGTLPGGTSGAPYTGSVGVTGGTAPYQCTVAAGTLPAGLTLNANCTVTGTPTGTGTTTVTVGATDSGNPAQSGTGPVSITISPAPVTISTGTLPNGTVNTPYTGTVGVTGGNGPYTCALAGGTLPTGLTLNANCSVTGTPTTAGTANVMVRGTDSSNPAQSGTGPVSITISPSTLNLATGSLPNGTVGTPYNANIGVTGGNGPYTCAVAGGTLPTGLTLNANCFVTGTPTVAGTSSVNVMATDSGNPAQSKTGPETITINPAPALTISSPPAATVNVPYTGNVPVTGGAGPYSCTLAGGTLPAGLTLNANCTITGTPTTAGTPTVSVQATDSSNPARTSTGNVTVTVNPNTGTLTPGNPPVATVNTPYTGTIPVTGGTGPYNCTVSGTLPAGLTLGANCTLTGTPTATGPSTVQVTATDSGSSATGTGPVKVTVQPVQPVTLTGTLPNGAVGQTYTQTLKASGGVEPYTYTVTAGNLPAGLTLSTTGTISGAPTTPGASSFTVTATDSEGTPQTASLPLVLLITYAPTANDALLNGPYAFLFQGYDDVAAGLLAYQTATAGSITADGAGAITAGEEDSNHQGSNPTGNTVPTRNVLGTYTVGADRRGLLTLTTFDTGGNVVATTTYAIALRAAVAPATNAAAGDLIEFDGDQLAGTRGSGTLLAQTSSAFTTGLAGSYAFGVKGDTPCLPSCTVGIASGPVATVGQFAATGGTINGLADTNIASNNTASSALSGSYTAADSNGRVQLNLLNAKLAGVPFPTDYAAYLVDANRVILLSTDKHSAYILQAGTAQLQTEANFSNSSLGAAYVGYENSPVSPGVLNTTLQNVLNLSTATVFRGAGNGNGTCSTTNVDSSGTTGVVNSLGGLVSAPVVQALLGSYQSLGNAGCTVAANGRAVLNYPAPNAVLQLALTGFGLPTTPAPRVAYLTTANQGYFLETGYAGLGMLEAQTGASYSNASLNGTYVYGSVPASTLATVNSSGVFTADGAGNTTSIVDRNVGVGTINVLQLGVTAAATYNITDTAAGRFLLSSGEVVYEIAPGRFVLLEPELVNTSAYVALLF